MKLCATSKGAAFFAAGKADGRCRIAGIVMLAIAAFAMSMPPARAQNLIDPSESIGSVPGFAGTGLFGLFFDNADGYSRANGSAPGATFLTTNLCFPDCLGNSFTDSSGGLTAFTNGAATNITFFTSNEPMRLTWDNSELDITGYIAINTPGTYSFTIGSDDNTNFTIGRSLFQVFGGGPQTTSDTFTAAGLYPIDVQFTEINGGSRLSITGTDPSGSCILGCYDGNLLENDLFYSDEQLAGAPAPVIGGGWPGFAFAALFGAGALAGRRRLGRLQHCYKAPFKY
jgi:hypothetical protein